MLRREFRFKRRRRPTAYHSQSTSDTSLWGQPPPTPAPPQLFRPNRPRSAVGISTAPTHCIARITLAIAVFVVATALCANPVSAGSNPPIPIRAPYGTALWDPTLVRAATFRTAGGGFYQYMFNVTLDPYRQWMILRLNHTSASINFTAHITNPGPTETERAYAGVPYGAPSYPPDSSLSQLKPPQSYRVWQRSRDVYSDWLIPDDDSGSSEANVARRVQTLTLKPTTSGADCIAAGGVRTGFLMVNGAGNPNAQTCTYTIIVKATAPLWASLSQAYTIYMNSEQSAKRHNYTFTVGVSGFSGVVVPPRPSDTIESTQPAEQFTLDRLSGRYIALEISNDVLPFKLSAKPSAGSDVRSHCTHGTPRLSVVSNILRVVCRLTFTVIANPNRSFISFRIRVEPTIPVRRRNHSKFALTIRDLRPDFISSVYISRGRPLQLDRVSICMQSLKSRRRRGGVYRCTR